MKSSALFSLLFLACFGSGAQTTDLTGSWSVDIGKTIGIMDNRARQQYDTLPAPVKIRATDAMKDREFIFNSNGNVTVNWKSNGTPRASTGTWTFIMDKLDITIDNRITGYQVEFKTTNEVILRGQGRSGFFNNLYLLRR